MSDLSLMTDRTVLALYGSHAVADGLHHTSTVECETELLRRLSRPSLADALAAVEEEVNAEDARWTGYYASYAESALYQVGEHIKDRLIALYAATGEVRGDQ